MATTHQELMKKKRKDELDAKRARRKDSAVRNRRPPSRDTHRTPQTAVPVAEKVPAATAPAAAPPVSKPVNTVPDHWDLSFRDMLSISNEAMQCYRKITAQIVKTKEVLQA